MAQRSAGPLLLAELLLLRQARVQLNKENYLSCAEEHWHVSVRFCSPRDMYS